MPHYDFLPKSSRLGLGGVDGVRVPTGYSVKAAWKASAVSFKVFPSTSALQNRHLANADFELCDKVGDDGNDEVSFQSIDSNTLLCEEAMRPLGFYIVSLAKRCYSIALCYTENKGYSQSSILISPLIPRLDLVRRYTYIYIYVA
jgi:hypothetical protein